ncbi:MAG TPA: AbrB/MazE/SpoVT family DNA-binding domain-containing protein [Candidatus Lokiarchaeia archaeon]|nr:AbrB/MazE/SpoVT family DNA-binding domain-containing protein [Candidatus Lokiarchaeia archaeon]
MTEKVEERISSNGRIVIPKPWRKLLSLFDNNLVELELTGDIITIKKKRHPLEDCIGLFNDYGEFTDEEHEEAKRSLFPSEADENT